MNVNYVNIGRGGVFKRYKYLSLIRFNKTREIFPSFTRALSILITISATSVERANSKELVPKVSGLSTAASYAQR